MEEDEDSFGSVSKGAQKRADLMDLAEFPNATCVPIFKYGNGDLQHVLRHICCSKRKYEKYVHLSIFKNMTQFLSPVKVTCVSIFNYGQLCQHGQSWKEKILTFLEEADCEPTCSNMALSNTGQRYYGWIFQKYQQNTRNRHKFHWWWRWQLVEW